MPDPYVGPERRTISTVTLAPSPCALHGEQVLALNIMKENADKKDKETGKIWDSLEQKVTYNNFKWAFGILLSVIIAVSSINYYTANKSTSAAYATMEKILESNHNVELGLVSVNSEIKSINDKLKSSYAEHEFFRSSVLLMLQHIASNPDNKDYREQMDKLQRKR